MNFDYSALRFAKVIMTAHEPVLKTVSTVKGMGIDTSLWRYEQNITAKFPNWNRLCF